MSSTIDYQRVAYRYEDKGEPCFIVLHEAGSSNCFESRTGRRARSWYVLADGWSYSVHGKIVRYASSACGGMLRLNSMGGAYHSDFSDVLRFIRAYDKAIKNAQPIESATENHRQVIEDYRSRKAIAV